MKAEDAQIVVIESYSNIERVNVGSVQYIGFKLVWSTNHSLVQNAEVLVGGKSRDLYIGGVFLFQVTSDTPQKKEYKIEKIVYKDKEVTYHQECLNPVIIWDQIVIELSSKESRINVDSEATIYWTAYHSYDGLPFSGEIFLNNTMLNYSSVGRHVYTVNYIQNDESEITSFTCNDLGIVWDRVEVSLTQLSERVDVGAEQPIKWKGHYEYDGLTFPGNVAFNISFPVSEVGKKHITVASITDPLYHLTSFHSDIIDVIFDKIELNLSIADSRVNVGDRIQITLNGTYAYDKEPFIGTVRYNDTHYKLYEPGKVGYKVSSITGQKYGLTTFSSNEVSCIWDRIKITLSADETRIETGTPVRLKLEGFYEYDGHIFDSIQLNDYNYTLNHVGSKQYAVIAIRDTNYNLTKYSSNNLTVIWDNVIVNIIVPYYRCIIGSSPTLKVEGYYAFDDTPFQGGTLFNDSLIKSKTGIYQYSVINITDTLYGLTKFTANDFSVIYDEINTSLTFSSLIPGKIDIYLRVAYKSDNTFIDEAKVTVNTKEITNSYDGTYIASIINWLPASSIQISIQRPDFPPIMEEKTILSIGNILVMGVLVLSAIIIYIKQRNINKDMYLGLIKR